MSKSLQEAARDAERALRSAATGFDPDQPMHQTLHKRADALHDALAAEQGQPTLDELKALWASEAITLQRERDELAALLEPRKRSNMQAITDMEDIARLTAERDELIAALRNYAAYTHASAYALDSNGRKETADGLRRADEHARALLARCEVK